jgi:hypothetical protein
VSHQFAPLETELLKLGPVKRLPRDHQEMVIQKQRTEIADQSIPCLMEIDARYTNAHRG